MIGALPEALTVGGEDYSIRTDYRNILDIFEAFQNHDLSDVEKWEVAIYMMFECFSCYDDAFEAAEAGFLVEGEENEFPIDEAIKQISWFIYAGQPEKQTIFIIEKECRSTCSQYVQIFRPCLVRKVFPSLQ